MFPKIKKEVGKFFLSEEGSISKKNIIKIGVILAGAGLVNAQKVVGSSHCNARNHCNVGCDEIYEDPGSGLIRVGEEAGLNFTAGSEHANMGWPADNVCHVRLVDNSNSGWIDPANDNSLVQEATHAWYSHDNSGAKRQKWYDLRRDCMSGILDNEIQVISTNQRSLRISHNNNLDVEYQEMVGKDVCGDQHNSNL